MYWGNLKSKPFPNTIQAKFILALLGWFNIQLQNTVKIDNYGGGLSKY